MEYTCDALIKEKQDAYNAVKDDPNMDERHKAESFNSFMIELNKVKLNNESYAIMMAIKEHA